ncbi:unnamed protein product, partial [Brassica rapa subsp. trilocularis]
NLPDDILTQILEIIGADGSWRLGPFLRAGKRSYDLVHQPQILCNCSCLNVGNIDAVYFESLCLASRHRDLEAAVALLEKNVPN